MVNTYNGSVNMCLPFGALIKEFVNDDTFEETNLMIDALEAIGNKVFIAMKLIEGHSEPSFKDKVMASLGKIKELFSAQHISLDSFRGELIVQGKEVHFTCDTIRGHRQMTFAAASGKQRREISSS
ncbi:hypothetical protein FRX31_034347 [Thalictrum thalictroides]|uniref:Uncharacterized protein n=1 Tax=Thalictrum thalictroides TaxID=46969 RepID=A0A7J6UU15_THATH|nr:hypothetical protein FRX31_034347 [Thalictrum thalictroides]